MNILSDIRLALLEMYFYSKFNILNMSYVLRFFDILKSKFIIILCNNFALQRIPTMGDIWKLNFSKSSLCSGVMYYVILSGAKNLATVH